MKPHPQADILRAIANGEEIEAFYDEEWYGVVPMTALRYIYDGNIPLRITPKTIKINEHTVPEPMRGIPGDDVSFWLADPTNQTGVCEFKWHPCPTHRGWLEAGLCHSTEEAAAIHANALLSLKRRI